MSSRVRRLELRGAYAACAVVAVASCALPELSIDPSLESVESAGSSTTSSGNASTAGNGNGGSSNVSQGGSNVSQGGSNVSQGGSSSGASNRAGSAGTGTAGSNGAGGSGCSTCDADACCEGACVDLQTDNLNCGACAAPCAADRTCSAGECACPGGLDLCGGSCIDLDTSLENCGACGAACAPDQTCSARACAGPCKATFEVSSKGFVTSPGAGGCLHGLATVQQDTTGDTTVSPADFSSCGEDCDLCLTGVVAGSPLYAGFALLSVSLNQASSGGPRGTVVPQADSLRVAFTNAGGSLLRVFLDGPNAESDPNDRWCADLSGPGSTIVMPYSQFKTTCWDNLGTPYGGQPLAAISVVAPGTTIDVPVNFCLESFADL